jgi:hypothetical protein
MPTKAPSAAQRLERMRRSFNKDYSVLAEDYEFFTNGAFITKDASTSPSKARRKSATPSVRKSPRRS